MKSFMQPDEHHAAVQRVLALGRSGDPAALDELIALTKLPSNEVQRLAASAIGKLGGFGADQAAAVAALVPLALRGRHPQTQQYALRALKAYAAHANACLHDLRDLANNPAQRDYVRAAALATVEAIEQAVRDGDAGVEHRCQRCHVAVTQEEHRHAQASFIIGEFQIRPDFYLPEVDVYIEYWGMDTPQYKMSMLKKQILYQQEGKRLVSVYPADLPCLNNHLRQKLALFGVCVGERSESAPDEDKKP